MGEAPKNQSPK